MTIYCSKCGKQIPENAKYCPYCGEEVVINRGNPDAVVIKLEKNNQEVVQSPAAAEDEVKTSKSDYVERNDELIAQYEEEIKTFEHRRRAMVIPGAIILGVFTIAAVVFFFLFYAELMQWAIDISEMSDPEFIENLPTTAYIYLMLLSVCSVLSDAGLALLLVGIIPNSIKITKRKNKIDQMKDLR